MDDFQAALSFGDGQPEIIYREEYQALQRFARCWLRGAPKRGLWVGSFAMLGLALWARLFQAAPILPHGAYQLGFGFCGCRQGLS